MAGMAFTFNVLENNSRNYVLHIVGVDTSTTTAYTSDGSSNGIIAANGYTGVSTSLKVRRIIYSTFNCGVRLQWHQTTNAELAAISGYDEIDLRDTQGIINPKETGSTGDIDLLTYPIASVTSGAGIVTAGFSLTLECIKGV